MSKGILSKILGPANALYLHSLFPSEEEKQEVKRRRKFYRQFLSDGNTYFDVGANLGNRIEPIIDDNIKIIAVEPQDQCIGYLKKKYGNRITVVPKGLGAKESAETMYISDAHTISSFSKDWIDATKKSGRFSKYNWDKTKEIQITTLDRLIEQYGLPDFIKIDVEGYEYQVLLGLQQSVPMVSIEYTVPEKTDMLLNCLERIESLAEGETLYNFSPGESMEWGLPEWLSFEGMTALVQSAEFLETAFGDVYAKTSR